MTPDTIMAGAHTWQVSNQGNQPYEVNLVKLALGKTEQNVITFYTMPAGPPPFVNLGGMTSISPGITGWVRVNLTGGNYVALSLVIDKAALSVECWCWTMCSTCRDGSSWKQRKPIRLSYHRPVSQHRDLPVLPLE